jgi:1-acyl-sn-glycerol-3-phosphate acyltransferase
MKMPLNIRIASKRWKSEIEQMKLDFQIPKFDGVFAVMDKTVRLAYQPYKWLVFIPLCFISVIAFGSVAIALSGIIGQKWASRIGGVWWGRFNCLMTPIIFSVEGRENIDVNQSYVIVANHKSIYDIFLLYGWLGIDFKWVMKQELRHAPILGFACDRIGHIFIDRSNSKAAVESIKAAKEKVVNGTSVLFFPEGTRSDKPELLPFKKGAFRMALDLDLPVLPISIIGTEKILPTKTLDIFPGKAKLVIHPPIDVSSYNEQTCGSLAARAQAEIASALPYRAQLKP